MRHTDLRAERMVRRYIREDDVFVDNPAEGLLWGCSASGGLCGSDVRCMPHQRNHRRGVAPP